jgi:hypothetical protein
MSVADSMLAVWLQRRSIGTQGSCEPVLKHTSGAVGDVRAVSDNPRALKSSAGPCCVL